MINMVIGAFEKCSKWFELKNISRRIFWNVSLYFSSSVFLRFLVVIDVKVSRKSPVDELVKEDLGGNDFDLTEYLIIFMFASTITLWLFWCVTHVLHHFHQSYQTLRPSPPQDRPTEEIVSFYGDKRWKAFIRLWKGQF